MGSVVLVKNSGQYDEVYKDFSEYLKDMVGIEFYALEHIGSTAIPNALTKGVVDVLVVAHDNDDVQQIEKALLSNGFKPHKDNHVRSRKFFASSPIESKQGDFHIHLIVASDDESKKLIIFRDRLRTDKYLRDQYNDLRSKVSEMTKTRAAYTKAKSDFIKNALDNNS